MTNLFKLNDWREDLSGKMLGVFFWSVPVREEMDMMLPLFDLVAQEEVIYVQCIYI